MRAHASQPKPEGTHSDTAHVCPSCAGRAEAQGGHGQGDCADGCEARADGQVCDARDQRPQEEARWLRPPDRRRWQDAALRDDGAESNLDD
eukprot:310526-Prymnesium_polylepis.2